MKENVKEKELHVEKVLSQTEVAKDEHVYLYLGGS